MNNKISKGSRLRIADEMSKAKIWYHGLQAEPDFLSRLFDLKSLKSRDSRYNNAYDDIYQHMVNNSDWDNNWVYTDPRTNLLYADDSFYLEFLSTTLLDVVRLDQQETDRLLDIYNRNLAEDGFEIIQTIDSFGNQIYNGQVKILGQAELASKNAEIKKYLDSDYVRNKIHIMNDAVISDTDLAIGTAKELLETMCKSILKQKNIVPDSNWTLIQLLKTTTSNLDFRPQDSTNPEEAEKSIKQILSGISSIVHGFSELRNRYGTGHGKDSDFKGLDSIYAKLFVGLISDVVIFYLSVNGENAELTED
jgi:hypothetical protein